MEIFFLNAINFRMLKTTRNVINNALFLTHRSLTMLDLKINYFDLKGVKPLRIQGLSLEINKKGILSTCLHTSAASN